MNKFILSKSTTLQNRFLIVGDSRIISKPENQKLIRNSKVIPEMPDTANTKVAAIYSSHEIEYFPQLYWPENPVQYHLFVVTYNPS